MSGKIIVIEGLDGCGKSTQFEILKNIYPEFRFITFPNYNSDSGNIIKQYLNGDFNEISPQASAYSASSFYAIDRYISYKNDWESDYNKGKIFISARYTTSNAIYQMTKLDKSLWNDYCNWLYDFEYNKLGIPVPDLVIFLDVPVEISQNLLSERYDGDESKKDVHESDIAFLKACHESAMFACNYKSEFNDKWQIVDCCCNNSLKNIDEISDNIKLIINKYLET